MKNRIVDVEYNGYCDPYEDPADYGLEPVEDYYIESWDEWY